MNKIMDPKRAEKISKALGDQYRLKMMEAISKQKDCMQCKGVLEMFELAQSTVSHHIKQLVDADLLIAEKDGRNAKYSVNNETFAEYIQYLNRFNK